ncbi:MAG: glycosyltransferase family 2 protein [Verrucomicrobiales bacterium]
MPAGPPAISKTHVLLIPSYNSGTLLRETVKQALNHHQPVWVIIDGSTDGSDSDLESIPAPASGLRVFRLPKNGGKGAALLHGATKAFAAGFTHLLTMDGDAQHPADYLPHYIEESRMHPGAMILGKPVFDDSAPLIRIYGRRLSNFWTILFTLGGGMKDCLFGMRAYPLPAFLRTLESTCWPDAMISMGKSACA